MHQRDNFLSLLSIIGGLALIIIGLKPFLIPALLIFGGFTLINYGLSLRRLPQISILIRQFFFRFK